MNKPQGRRPSPRGGAEENAPCAGRKMPPVPPSPEKALSLLGIARRAGRLAMGMDPVTEAMQKKKAALVLLSPDISPRSRKKAQEQAERYGAELMEMPFGMDEICAALGKRSGVIAVCDGGFAGKLKELLAFTGGRPDAFHSLREQAVEKPGPERRELREGAPETEETEEESHL